MFTFIFILRAYFLCAFKKSLFYNRTESIKMHYEVDMFESKKSLYFMLFPLASPFFSFALQVRWFSFSLLQVIATSFYWWLPWIGRKGGGRGQEIWTYTFLITNVKNKAGSEPAPHSTPTLPCPPHTGKTGYTCSLFQFATRNRGFIQQSLLGLTCVQSPRHLNW